MRYLLMFVVFVCLFDFTLLSQSFEGEVKKISHYDPSGETIEYFRSIWYYNSEQDYLTAEKQLFNDLDVAFRTEKFQMIADDQSINVLEELGVFCGLFRGYYYPKGSSVDETQIKQTFMAYIAIDLSKYHIRVQFRGAYNQYMLNYKLDAPVKNGYAFFRIPSTEYKKDIEYMILAERNQTKMNVTAVYNKQELKLTITRKETPLASLFRKVGINKRQILLFPQG